MAKKATKVQKRTTPAGIPAAYAQALQKARTMELGGRFWSPEKEGDSIMGRVTSVHSVKGKFGRQTQVSIQTLDGTVKTVTCGTVLEGLVKDNEVGPGQEIVITYRGLSKGGKGSGKKGKPAKLFTLVKVEG